MKLLLQLFKISIVMAVLLPLSLHGQNDTLLIDFGNNISPVPWNNITAPRDGAILNMTNSAGNLTGFGVAITDTFNNINTAGTQEPDASLGFPPTATGDSFFGNVATFGGREEPTGGITITGLPTDRAYTFNIFSSRPASDNRQARYDVIGATTESDVLNAANNTDMIATATVFPNDDGEIMVIAQPGPENDNGSGFYFMGAMQVIYESIPVEVEIDTVIVDLGDVLSPEPINNLGSATTGMIFDLTNMKGAFTGYSIAVSDAFNGINRTGSDNPDPALGLPVTVTDDSFFGNVAPFAGKEEPTGAVTFEGLSIGEAYSFDIYASRAGATDTREAQYVVTGAGEETVILNATDNDSMLVSATMMPAADGTITITASPGPNNDNASGFYFMGAVRMMYEAIPPPIVVSIDSVLIDFGDNLSAAPWINITDPQAGAASDMVSKFGIETGIDVAITDAFNNINRTGVTNANPDLGFPITATADNFFGNVTPFGGQEQPTGGMDFTDLDTAKVYTFTIFASRAGVSDQREAKYTITGASVDTMLLNATDNTENAATISMKPDESGKINLLAETGPNNDNGAGFYFIGAVILSYDVADPPAPFDTLLVDFGNILTPLPWNNITDPKEAIIENVPRSDGFLSGYSLRIVDDFNNINRTGEINTDPILGLPSTVSGDSFFGNVAEFGGQEQPTAGLLLEGLKVDKEYTVELFASRTATDNRDTQYEIIGETTEVRTLNAASNTDKIVSGTVKPAADGTINIAVSPGPENSNASQFYFLGAMRVIYDEEEASGDADVILTQPNGGEVWQVGKTATIRWESRNVGQLTAEYSTDNGDTWNNIAQVTGGLGVLDWTIPDNVSTECLVRIGDGIVGDESRATFEITDDQQTCRIVVLGSSTAAGTGPSSADSTWVNRYVRSLEHSTRFEVENLARGGYTTYNVIPTGTTPAGVSILIDEDRNINAALALNPFAVIVNMPSNDAANNIAVEEQIANFDAIIALANAQGVDVFICTPQPRNFGNQAQIDIQTALLQAVNDKYGSNAIDFWSDIALADGTVDPQYDSGDGVHVNNAAHGIFFDRVDAVGLGEVECGIIVNTENVNADYSNARLYPNPTYGPIQIDITTSSAADITVEMLDVSGRLLNRQSYKVNHDGTHTIATDVSEFLGNSLSFMYAKISVSDINGKTQTTIPLISK